MTFPSEDIFHFLTKLQRVSKPEVSLPWLPETEVRLEWSPTLAGRHVSYCMWDMLTPKLPRYAEEDARRILGLITYEDGSRAKEYLLKVMNERLEEAQARKAYIPAADFFEELIHAAESQTDSLTTARMIDVGFDVMLRGAELYTPFFDWAAQRISDDAMDDASALWTILKHEKKYPAGSWVPLSIYQDHCPDGIRLLTHANTAGKMAELVERHPHMVKPIYTEMCATLITLPMIAKQVIKNPYEQPHEEPQRIRLTERKEKLVAAVEQANTQGCIGLKTASTGFGAGHIRCDARDLFPEPMVQGLDLVWRSVSGGPQPSAINLKILPTLVMKIKGYLSAAYARPPSVIYDRGYTVVNYTGSPDPK